MGTSKYMFYNALLIIGWLIIISSIVSDLLSFQGIIKLLHEFGGWEYPEVRETIASFVTGIFQGLGLGLLCLYAAHTFKPFGDKK